jgi:hypothetical protein
MSWKMKQEQINTLIILPLALQNKDSSDGTCKTSSMIFHNKKKDVLDFLCMYLYFVIQNKIWHIIAILKISL